MFRHAPRHFYWSSDGGFWRCDHDATETCHGQDRGLHALQPPRSADARQEPSALGHRPRALALDGSALFVAERAGRIVRIQTLPPLGTPEEIAIGLPPIDAIAFSPDRIYLIADAHLIVYLPKL